MEAGFFFPRPTRAAYHQANTAAIRNLGFQPSRGAIISPGRVQASAGGLGAHLPPEMAAEEEMWDEGLAWAGGGAGVELGEDAEVENQIELRYEGRLDRVARRYRPRGFRWAARTAKAKPRRVRAIRAIS